MEGHDLRVAGTKPTCGAAQLDEGRHRSVSFVLAGAEVVDKTIALEALQGRVDLPNVDGPRPTRPSLEGSLELVAVRRRLSEQREQSEPNRHVHLAWAPEPDDWRSLAYSVCRHKARS